MRSSLDEVVSRQKAGLAQGITSVCSAHPLVIEAAVQQALESGDHLLVEATSNQVDQYGGYTGMRPADFRDLVHRIAVEGGLQLDRVILGGDHLGPNRWRALPPDAAMEKARALVAAYVSAGFTKIHLDCSFACQGDPTPLTDDLVAERAAQLIRAAEDAAGPQGAYRIRYVIGTEVPTPGGAHEELGALLPTTADAARTTLEQHRKAFALHGVEDVWPRVMALVVQPAVEFDHLRVVDYRRELTAELRTVLDKEPAMVFEAHSTDYQTVEALTALVEDHWAVLKVGPGLTFALREALFALAAIEEELVPALPSAPASPRSSSSGCSRSPPCGRATTPETRPSSASPAATATATGCVTFGPTPRSAVPRHACSTTWRPWTSRCLCSARIFPTSTPVYAGENSPPAARAGRRPRP